MKKIGILYNSASIPTAPNLANKLNVTPINESELYKIFTKKIEVLIRYGSTCTIEKNLIEINPKSAIEKCIDRVKFYEEAKKHNIPTPYFTNENEIQFPVYVYIKNGYQGNSLVLCFSKKDIERLKEFGYNPIIYSKVIETAHEYRIHIIKVNEKLDYYAFLVYEKIPTEINAFTFVVRNKNLNKYKFATIGSHEFGFYSKELYNAIELCYKTLKALNLDFAGIDILIDLKGNPYIIDCNSAPGHGYNTRKFYAKYLKELIKVKLQEKIRNYKEILKNLR